MRGLLALFRRWSPLERSIRSLRATAWYPVDYRAPAREDAGLVALLLLRIEPAVQKLRKRGLRELGDLVLAYPGQPPRGILRAYVDDRGTTCVYVLVSTEQPLPAIPVIESYTQDAEYMTQIGAPEAGLAIPPFSHRQQIAATVPFADILASHRTFARIGAPDVTHVTIASLDDLVREFRRIHQLIAAWRAKQDPDTLLEADLRNLLGARFERDGPPLMRRLRDELPRARVYRR